MSKNPKSTRKRSRDRSPSVLTAQCDSRINEGTRSSGEWQELCERGVLALLPTPAMVQHALRRSTSEGSPFVVKIGGFDLDDTLIMPLSGGVFATDDPADWRWLHSSIPQTLQQLHASGFLLTLFSNQAGINKNRKWDDKKACAIKEKIIRIGQELQVPLSAFIATRDDEWRKPSTGMWGLLQEHLLTAVTLPAKASLDCHALSFFVGDAAGRSIKTLAGRKKDFSCSDRKFAYNLSLHFFSPEQFFLRSSTPLLHEDPNGCGAVLHPSMLERTRDTLDDVNWGGVSPMDLAGIATSYAGLKVRCVRASGSSEVTIGDPPRFACDGVQEMVLLVGMPGCGKTTFYRRFFEPYHYVHINRDVLHTKARCLREAEQAWRAGRSVVVDNTNPSRADREGYINIVRQSFKKPSPSTPLPVRVMMLMHTKQLASHMNRMRARLGVGAVVPPVAFNLFQSKLELCGPRDIRDDDIESVWEVPPVACFDRLPPRARAVFYLLS